MSKLTSLPDWLAALRDPLVTEAYLHGRTKYKLEDARAALNQIAGKRVKNYADGPVDRAHRPIQYGA